MELKARLDEKVGKLRSQTMTFSNDGMQISLSVPDTGDVKETFGNVIETVADQQDEIFTLQSTIQQMASDHAEETKKIIQWTTKCMEQLQEQNKALESKLLSSQQQIKNLSYHLQGYVDDTPMVNIEATGLMKNFQLQLQSVPSTPHKIPDFRSKAKPVTPDDEKNSNTLFPTEDGASLTKMSGLGFEGEESLPPINEEIDLKITTTNPDDVNEPLPTKPSRKAKTKESRLAAKLMYYTVGRNTLPLDIKARWRWAIRKVIILNKNKKQKVSIANSRVVKSQTIADRMMRIEETLFMLPIQFQTDLEKESESLNAKLNVEVNRLDETLSSVQASINQQDNIVDEKIKVVQEQIDDVTESVNELETKLEDTAKNQNKALMDNIQKVEMNVNDVVRIDLDRLRDGIMDVHTKLGTLKMKTQVLHKNIARIQEVKQESLDDQSISSDIRQLFDQNNKPSVDVDSSDTLNPVIPQPQVEVAPDGDIPQFGDTIPSPNPDMVIDTQSQYSEKPLMKLHKEKTMELTDILKYDTDLREARTEIGAIEGSLSVIEGIFHGLKKSIETVNKIRKRRHQSVTNAAALASGSNDSTFSAIIEAGSLISQEQVLEIKALLTDCRGVDGDIKEVWKLLQNMKLICKDHDKKVSQQWDILNHISTAVDHLHNHTANLTEMEEDLREIKSSVRSFGENDSIASDNVKDIEKEVELFRAKLRRIEKQLKAVKDRTYEIASSNSSVVSNIDPIELEQKVEPLVKKILQALVKLKLPPGLASGSGGNLGLSRYPSVGSPKGTKPPSASMEKDDAVKDQQLNGEAPIEQPREKSRGTPLKRSFGNQASPKVAKANKVATKRRSDDDEDEDDEVDENGDDDDEIASREENDNDDGGLDDEEENEFNVLDNAIPKMIPIVHNRQENDGNEFLDDLSEDSQIHPSYENAVQNQEGDDSLQNYFSQMMTLRQQSGEAAGMGSAEDLRTGDVLMGMAAAIQYDSNPLLDDMKKIKLQTEILQKKLHDFNQNKLGLGQAEKLIRHMMKKHKGAVEVDDFSGSFDDIGRTVRDLVKEMIGMKDAHNKQLDALRSSMQESIESALETMQDYGNTNTHSVLNTRALCLSCGRTANVRVYPTDPSSGPANFFPSLNSHLTPGPDILRGGFKMPARAQSPPSYVYDENRYKKSIVLEDFKVDRIPVTEQQVSPTTQRQNSKNKTQLLMNSKAEGINESNDPLRVGFENDDDQFSLPPLSPKGNKKGKELRKNISDSIDDSSAGGANDNFHRAATAGYSMSTVVHAQGRPEAQSLRPIFRKGFPAKKSLKAEATFAPERYDLLLSPQQKLQKANKHSYGSNSNNNEQNLRVSSSSTALLK